MKKQMMLWLFSFAMLLSGCNSIQNSQENNALQWNLITNEDKEIIYKNDTEIILESEDFEINIYDSVFQRVEQDDLIFIIIHYPQIRFSNENGIDVPEVLNKINKQIFEYLMQDTYFEWQDSRYNAVVNYEITYVGKDYFSVVFEGYHNEFNHERTPSALNFDLNTGELISLENYFSTDYLLQVITENPDCIQEEDFIDIVGGKEGVLDWLKNNLLVGTHQNDFAITESGLKFIIFSEGGSGKEYCIVDIILEQ